MAAKSLPDYLLNRKLPREYGLLLKAGRLADADAWLAARLAEAVPTSCEADTITRERQRLQRLTRDYSVSEEDFLAKINGDIPGVSAEDLKRWRRAKALQWLPIEGQVRYFRREPVNLFRFSTEAREGRVSAPDAAQRDPSAEGDASFVLEDALAGLVEQAAETQDELLAPVRFRIRHRASVHPGVVPEGEVIRCWFPFPKPYRNQTGGCALSTTPSEHFVASAEAPQRTVYMEQYSAGDSPTEFEAEYSFERRAYMPKLTAKRIARATVDPAMAAKYLPPRPPHLPLGQPLRQLVRKIVKREANPYRRAERLFEWIQEHIEYAAEREYSVFPCIEEMILAERRCDCGVQALLFIALCRAAGIPARWQSGWVVRPDRWGMHDWAEFHVAPFGWLPADPSFGWRKSDDIAVRRFFFGNQDPWRMIANSDFNVPFSPGTRHWRSDPVDSQRGEVEWRGGNLFYDQWDYSVEILEQIPLSAAPV